MDDGKTPTESVKSARLVKVWAEELLAKAAHKTNSNSGDNASLFMAGTPYKNWRLSYHSHGQAVRRILSPIMRRTAPVADFCDRWPRLRPTFSVSVHLRSRFQDSDLGPCKRH